MKKIYKIFLSIISILSIVILITILSLFSTIPVLSVEMAHMTKLYAWMNDLFAGFLAFFILCLLFFLVYVVLSPSDTDRFVIKNDKGNLQFTKKMVASTIQYSFADLQEVHHSQVHVHLGNHPEKIKINVRLSLVHAVDSIELTETIQNKIQLALRSSLGITSKHINIILLANDELEKNNNNSSLKHNRLL